MSKYKWQHYLPQMYLTAWIDPKRVEKGQHDLWLYRIGEAPKSRGPKGVAAEADLYTAAEIVDDPKVAEKGLGEIEGEAVALLDKLRSGNIALSAEEKSELATYVGIQVCRTPLAFAKSNAVAVELTRQLWKKKLDEGSLKALVEEYERDHKEKLGVDQAKFEDFVSRIVRGEIELVQQSKGWNVKNMLERGGELGSVLETMHWGLLEAADGQSFITSDNPAHIADPPAKDAGPKKFRFSDKMQFAFPISPKYLLFGDFARRDDETKKLDEFQTSKFNEDQIEFAYREIYASFESNELKEQMEKIFKERAPLIPTLPPGAFD